MGDGEELLVNLDGDGFVIRVLGRQLQRHHRHVQGEHRHPAGGVGLLEGVAGRQRVGAVEHRDVVQAEKTALEHVVALAVLAIDPPGVVQQQLVKHPFEKMEIAPAALNPFGAKHFQGAHGVYRRIDVAERPFVGGNLPVGVEVVFLQHQFDLILGEIDIDQRQRGAVVSQIPGREPGIFPLVGHGDDIGRLEMSPGAVAAPFPTVGRREVVAVQPAGHVVMEELLAPDHAGQGLAQNALILGRGFGQQFAIEQIRFGLAAGEYRRIVGEGLLQRCGAQYQFHLRLLAAGHGQPVPGGELGAFQTGIDRVLFAVHHAPVEAVLDPRRGVGQPP